MWSTRRGDFANAPPRNATVPGLPIFDTRSLAGGIGHLPFRSMIDAAGQADSNLAATGHLRTLDHACPPRQNHACFCTSALFALAGVATYYSSFLELVNWQLPPRFA
ncbi:MULTISPECIES: hypothetical protein [unclassified Bradyrhizobium]|uniref:hypothetical protein n=1 Tax=unclassified Bradyrhizobium TaxID=2631580 RepID=UPI0024E0D9E4|nr:MULTISPECIES: hypothetical protein [unclassified Bradyrhizobium]